MNAGWPAETAHVEELDDGTVIWLERRGTMHLLDPLAARLWRRLLAAPLPQVLREVADEAGGKAARAEADVRALAGRLARAGLLPPDRRLRVSPRSR